MARPRTFDENQLLIKVARIFRHKGYATSSVRDLEAATGLTSGSLYNTYGDKRGLFEAASAHYNQSVLARRLAQYAPEGSGTKGLLALFLSLLNEPDGGSSGCLITNSAVEFGAKDTPRFVAEGFATLRDVFAERLGGKENEALALLALYQGTLVLIRAGYDKSDLETMLTHYFEQLETTDEP